jgi:hypothetical protein
MLAIVHSARATCHVILTAKVGRLQPHKDKESLVSLHHFKPLCFEHDTNCSMNM